MSLEAFIANFEAKCAAAGHYWADDPRTQNGQYCKACGETRIKPTAYRKAVGEDEG